MFLRCAPFKGLHDVPPLFPDFFTSSRYRLHMLSPESSMRRVVSAWPTKMAGLTSGPRLATARPRLVRRDGTPVALSPNEYYDGLHQSIVGLELAKGTLLEHDQITVMECTSRASR
jgi:hypothetical protein